eukprot:595682-Prymnesium_polylepis.4
MCRQRVDTCQRPSTGNVSYVVETVLDVGGASSPCMYRRHRCCLGGSSDEHSAPPRTSGTTADYVGETHLITTRCAHNARCCACAW